MTDAGGFAAEQLKSYVERIERLSEERVALGSDLRDVYSEAKANGYCPKALKVIIRRRAQDADVRAELDALVELYENALGAPK